MKMAKICPVFLCEDVRKTTRYYVETLGFGCAEHFDKQENFATVYRDAIEIVLVQRKQGRVESNHARHGGGDDAYIVPASLEAVEALHEEFARVGVRIVVPLGLTDYGSLEFTLEDCDGRRVGIGLIAYKKHYFRHTANLAWASGQ